MVTPKAITSSARNTANSIARETTARFSLAIFHPHRYYCSPFACTKFNSLFTKEGAASAWESKGYSVALPSIQAKSEVRERTQVRPRVTSITRSLIFKTGAMPRPPHAEKLNALRAPPQHAHAQTYIWVREFLCTHELQMH